MKKIYLFLLFQSAIFVTLLGATIKTTSVFGIRQIFENVSNNTDTTYRIIPATNKTYGYEILIKNRVLIRQLTIPGKSGMLGFKKKNDAEKVAQLVLRKLSKGLMPPTIDDKELRELKIKL